MGAMKSNKSNKSGLGRKGKAMYYFVLGVGAYYVVRAIIGLITI